MKKDVKKSDCKTLKNSKDSGGKKDSVDSKNLKNHKAKNTSDLETLESKSQNIARHNFLIARLKAFVTDMFLINMPLLYFVAYIILSGKDSFQENHLVIGLCECTYCMILLLFFYFSGQTPGFRYAEIMLVDGRSLKNSSFTELDGKYSKNIESNNHKNLKSKNTKSMNPKPNTPHGQLESKLNTPPYKTPTFLQSCIYIFVWIFETTFFLWVIFFIRKDRKTLHELVSHTKIIYKKNTRI